MSALIHTLVANLPLILLSLALVVGGVWAYRLWRDMHEEADSGGDASPLGLLDQIREAHAAGEIDDAEYERVRQRLFKNGAGGSRTRNTDWSESDNDRHRVVGGDAREQGHNGTESPTAPAD